MLVFAFTAYQFKVSVFSDCSCNRCRRPSTYHYWPLPAPVVSGNHLLTGVAPPLTCFFNGRILTWLQYQCPVEIDKQDDSKYLIHTGNLVGICEEKWFVEIHIKPRSCETHPYSLRTDVDKKFSDIPLTRRGRMTPGRRHTIMWTKSIVN